MSSEVISCINVSGSAVNQTVSGRPNNCPFCHQKVSPKRFKGFIYNNSITVIYQCTNDECNEIFLGYFKSYQFGYYYTHSTIGKPNPTVFSDIITKISKDFVEIYGQAETALNMGLNRIGGISFRKSLEFLIKDYLIIIFPKDKIKIEKSFLSNCINDYISNTNIKATATKAVWLGNDETHYVRKWKDKDIKDLILLIGMTVAWMELEELTKKYNNNMSK